MMGDGSLPKRCPAKYQRLVMISGDYHVEYCVNKEVLELRKRKNNNIEKGLKQHLDCIDPCE